MNRAKLRKGVPEYTIDYSHLLGRLDSEALLEDLGIDFGYRHSKNQLMYHCPNLEGNHRNGDANPSFGFQTDKLLYNCFVCGGGNVVELVQMMHPGQTQEQALQYAEKFADFNITQDDFVNKVQSILHPEEETEAPMPEYPPDALFQYRKIHPYLLDRGMTREAIIDLQVGYVEEHDAILFPHFFMGKLVGMQQRHITQNEAGDYVCARCSENEKRGRVPKYKNTPNFPKINTLYGYDHMKEAVKEEGVSSVIVVESPMSVLKLRSLGFNRAVATFGQFSREQAMLLIAMERVYYWPDNDAAGFNNAKNIIDVLFKYTDLRVVPVVDGEKGDAGDLNSAAEVSRHLKGAYPAAIFGMYSKDHLLTMSEFELLLPF